MKAVRAEVELLRFTPLPDELVAYAAKLCYASDLSALNQWKDGEVDSFVGQLRDMGHLSPLEHSSFTFLIQGVSRAMTHQLVRHRIASYSQRSQRYVRHEGFDYIRPPSLQGKWVEVDGERVNAEEFFDETMRILAERYRLLLQALGDKGERSNEDARYVLPNACETKIMVTMNARELLHFFGQRLCQRAQWEIREVAERMLALVRKVCPAVFQGAGPKCVYLGGCPEGRLSCGRYKEMLERYGSRT